MNNIDGFINYLNLEEIEYKKIENGDETKLITYLDVPIQILSNDQLYDSKYIIGTVNCLFGNDVFSIIKKVVKIKGPKNNEVENYFRTKSRYMNYEGMKSYYDNGFISTALRIPYAASELDLSMIIASYARYLYNFELFFSKYIEEIANWKYGGIYCENE